MTSEQHIAFLKEADTKRTTGRGTLRSIFARSLHELVEWVCTASGYTVLQALQFLPVETVFDRRWSTGGMFVDVTNTLMNGTNTSGT